ncbi:MAG: DNA-directed DNA polymerase II small subunit [Promethearchaeota archaeon]
MKAENTEVKKVIIKRLVKSGINITPTLLDILLDLDDPIKKINKIIKNSSFIANFRSHLTDNILSKISDEEIKSIMKRKLLKQEINSTEEYLHEKENINNNQTTLLKDDIHKVDETIEVKAAADIPETKTINQIKLETSATLETLEIENFKRSKINIIEGTSSKIAFKPIAKEYNSEFTVLKDPTGKLYTNGDYTDFYDLTFDKFNKLRDLMRKRIETNKADNINNILRLSNKVEVSVIGLVNKIRITKNGYYILTLEDITGLINIIIKKEAENQENVKVAERTLNDQMVYIEGTFNPGDKGKPGIIYGNYISKIDIPKDFMPNKSNDPLSIVLISDTHIGSKEFEVKLWKRFIEFLNGKLGNKLQRDRASRIKYIVINGDLVDGIGVYPTQKTDLQISNIYEQFDKAAELLTDIPEYIKIFYSSGNHEPVRNAIPRPAVPKKYSKKLIDIGVSCIGNPSLIKTHNVNTLVFHGDSILDVNMLIPGMEHEKSVETMKEFLKCRHLAPVYGKKTQIAPTHKDWLVIDKIPDIFHTGHVHINDMGSYNNILLVNSGCFQSQTDFMNSLGIHPTPGILAIIDLDSLKGTQLDLKSNI